MDSALPCPGRSHQATSRAVSGFAEGRQGGKESGRTVVAAGVLPVSDGLGPALCRACSKAEGQRINDLRALKPPSRSATRLGAPRPTAPDQADLCWRLRPPVWLRMGLDPCCRRGGRWDGPERCVIVRRKYADNPLQLLATTSSPDSGWEPSTQLIGPAVPRVPVAHPILPSRAPVANGLSWRRQPQGDARQLLLLYRLYRSRNRPNPFGNANQTTQRERLRPLRP